jgi:biuret amidohydrolase
MTLAGAVPATGARVTVASQPYQWPYHGRLRPERTAMVVVVDQAWPEMVAPAPGSPARRAAAIARHLVAQGGAVVSVSAGPAGLPFAAEPSPLYHHVQCRGSSGFYASSLDAVLRRLGRSDLVLCGWGLEGPVHSTMRSANDMGYECLLVPDASVAADPDMARPACEMVRMSGGIFGAWAATAEVVAALDTLARARGGLIRQPIEEQVP